MWVQKAKLVEAAPVRSCIPSVSTDTKGKYLNENPFEVDEKVVSDHVEAPGANRGPTEVASSVLTIRNKEALQGWYEVRVRSDNRQRSGQEFSYEARRAHRARTPTVLDNPAYILIELVIRIPSCSHSQ